MTLLRRLLDYPHRAVFDISPQKELAFSLEGPSDVSWSVADELLCVRTGHVTKRYELESYTVGALRSALIADGFDVSPVSSVFAGYTATILVEGDGKLSLSNGGHLYGFTSLIWSLFSAYARELKHAKKQIGEALRQMIIYQAEGEFLDLWGKLFSVARDENECDADYARRVPQEAFRLRVNRYAIEKAVHDITGKSIRITEPWNDMFRLDEARLSSLARLPDDEHYRYCYIRPESQVPMDWDDALAVIERNRATGVMVLKPESRYVSVAPDSLCGKALCGIQTSSSIAVHSIYDDRLDWMRLGETVPHRNWKSGIAALHVSPGIDFTFGEIWMDRITAFPELFVDGRFFTRAPQIGGSVDYGRVIDLGFETAGKVETYFVTSVSSTDMPAKVQGPKIVSFEPAGLYWNRDRTWGNVPWDDIIERDVDRYLISEDGEAFVTENETYMIL